MTVVAGIQVQHRKVGTKHVFTSDTVPELYVAHADESVARGSVESALAALARSKANDAARAEIESIARSSRGIPVAQPANDASAPSGDRVAVAKGKATIR